MDRKLLGAVSFALFLIGGMVEPALAGKGHKPCCGICNNRGNNYGKCCNHCDVCREWHHTRCHRDRQRAAEAQRQQQEAERQRQQAAQSQQPPKRPLSPPKRDDTFDL